MMFNEASWEHFKQEVGLPPILQFSQNIPLSRPVTQPHLPTHLSLSYALSQAKVNYQAQCPVPSSPSLCTMLWHSHRPRTTTPTTPASLYLAKSGSGVYSHLQVSVAR